MASGPLAPAVDVEGVCQLAPGPPPGPLEVWDVLEVRHRSEAQPRDRAHRSGQVQQLAHDECRPVKHRLRSLVHDKVAEVEAHLTEQAAFADQLRATAAALATRPLDGPCDDTCGCTDATVADQTVSASCGSACACATADEGVPLSRRADQAEQAGQAPILCSLSQSDMDRRMQQWERVLDEATGRLPLPGGIRVELSDSTPIAELAGVVEAEHRCCPFLSFTITVDRRGPALEVTAPAEGHDLLAAIFGKN